MLRNVRDYIAGALVFWVDEKRHWFLGVCSLAVLVASVWNFGLLRVVDLAPVFLSWNGVFERLVKAGGQVAVVGSANSSFVGWTGPVGILVNCDLTLVGSAGVKMGF